MTNLGAMSRMELEAMFSAVRTILMRDWDPIEINDDPVVTDEYDRYVRKIIDLLQRGVSVSELSEHLLQIETLEMGLRGDRGRALRVAETLTAFAAP